MKARHSLSEIFYFIGIISESDCTFIYDLQNYQSRPWSYCLWSSDFGTHISVRPLLVPYVNAIDDMEPDGGEAVCGTSAHVPGGKVQAYARLA
jgi:hypothetical protein